MKNFNFFDRWLGIVTVPVTILAVGAWDLNPFRIDVQVGIPLVWPRNIENMSYIYIK